MRQSLNFNGENGKVGDVRSFRLPSGTPNELLKLTSNEVTRREKEHEKRVEYFCDTFLQLKESHRSERMKENHKELLDKPGKLLDMIQGLGYNIEEESNGDLIITPLIQGRNFKQKNIDEWSILKSDNLFAVVEEEQEEDDEMDTEEEEDNEMVPYSPYEESHISTKPASYRMGDTGGRVAVKLGCVHGDSAQKYQVMQELIQKMAEIKLELGKECLEIADPESDVKSKYENTELIQ